MTAVSADGTGAPQRGPTQLGSDAPFVAVEDLHEPSRSRRSTAVRRLCMISGALAGSRIDRTRRSARRTPRARRVAGQERPRRRDRRRPFSRARPARPACRSAGSKLTDSSCTRPRSAASADAVRWISANRRSISGQKSGSGQRVYMNVTARTLAAPVGERVARVPCSSRRSVSGIASPGCRMSTRGRGGGSVSGACPVDGCP